MPKELVELRGEPFAFGLGFTTDLELVSGKGSPKIEKAVDVTDVCPGVRYGEKVLLLFTTIETGTSKLHYAGLLRTIAEFAAPLHMQWWLVTDQDKYPDVGCVGFKIKGRQVAQLQREYAPWRS
ncbi:MAG: hypothetical protein Q8P73_00225 [bacterium]|nr:hypothetical protein [bacterium]